ncbi:bifunctional RING-type zinc-finger [Babesia duncani]|uniref:Bifunctional RING-type zinc-finger n=1 Tax=Babesia duncani TaxID=323732 RepID=A0AAD9UPD5_9APIC|nr:bifunctional RING-type zinc-finger [Babesia duncani]
MQSGLDISPKRSYQRAMGHLIDDATLLYKKRKTLFSDINIQLDRLVYLLREIGKKLGADANNHPLICSDYNNGSSCSSKTPPADANGSECDSDELSNFESTLLYQMASAVKMFDCHKKVHKAFKAFNEEFSDYNNEISVLCSADYYNLITPIKPDEQLVCNMIAIHFLHYGLFEVYDIFKEECIQLWGKDNRALVLHDIIVAFKKLHAFLNNIQEGKCGEAIDWIKSVQNASVVSEERFNFVLLDLCKIHFLGHLFERDENGVLHHSNKDISENKVLQLREFGVSSLWRKHHEEIGKLTTQVLLHHNIPSPPEFEDMINISKKKFRRVYCDHGILIRKSKLHKCRDSDVSDANKGPQESNSNPESSAEPDESPYGNAQIENASSIVTTDFKQEIPGFTDKIDLNFKDSWISLLDENINTFVHKSFICPSPYLDNSLKDNWLDPNPPILSKRKPRISYKSLKPECLNQSIVIDKINCILTRGTLDHNLWYSKEALASILADPESLSHQIIPEGYDLSSLPSVPMDDGHDDTNVPHVRNTSDSSSIFGSWEQHATTVLITTTEDLDEESVFRVSNIGQLIENDPFVRAATEEQSGSSTPATFSLTLFTGSSILRDNINIGGEDTRITTNPSGSRIRISFPSRGLESEIQTSRRSSSRELSTTGILRPLVTSGETSSTSPTFQSSTLNLREILRLIMRGVRGENITLPSTQAQTETSRRTEMTQGSPEESRRSRVATNVRLGELDDSVLMTFKYSETDYATPDHIRVFLPFESPINIIAVAGLITFPNLLKLLNVVCKDKCEAAEKVETWIKTNQLPIESNLGPAFHFHSYFTCAVSKDETSPDNLPMMLPCGHVMCSVCVDRLAGKRRRRQFKCPLCPNTAAGNQVNFCLYI